MSMIQLVEQYQEQLNIIKQQLRDLEQNDIAVMDRHKYRQLKQIKNELQTNIHQMKKYIKKG